MSTMTRDQELTIRLANLIALLAEDSPDAPEPPADAAQRWTEAAVRAFFRSGGAELPPLAPENEAPCGSEAAAQEQPGGGRLQIGSDWADQPQAVRDGRMATSAEEYRAAALAYGIPLRPNGLFPARDPVIAEILAEGFRPFTKHLIGGRGTLEPCDDCWSLGPAACAHGLDLRYFYRPPPEGAGGGAHGELAAAVRWSDEASIGKGFWSGVHGGSVETAFDDATAELAKMDCAAAAMTLELTATFKKPTPLHTTCRLDARVVGVAGLRVNTEATLKAEGVVLVTCKAQLVDTGKLMLQQPRK